MREIRRAAEGIRWPREKICRARRDEESGEPPCICRNYEGAEGYYVIAEDGHAVAYYKERKDAVAALGRRPAAPRSLERVRVVVTEEE